VSATVLVVGGGLTGLEAAVELAAGGARAVVVERGPIVGGKRGALLLGGDGVDTRLAGVGENPGIELLTLSDLESVGGEAGRFEVLVRQSPRYVNEDCTRCNHCAPVCPQAVPNEYDAGLTFRKAIHSPFPQTIPDIYAIDINTCLNMPPNYLPCQRCVEVCDDRAIHFDMVPREPLKFEVGAVVLATGYVDNDEQERESLGEFGYGRFPDVVSSVELQRMLEDPGPSGGFAIRPSDEGYPERALLVLTRPSAGAAWVMANQLRRLLAQGVGVEVLVLSADREDPVLAELAKVAEEVSAPLHFGSWIGVDAGEEGALVVRFAGFPGGARVERGVDLVALSSEAHPHPEVPALAEKLGLMVDDHGYLQASREGIYLAGGVLGTVGIEAGAEQARTVARAALQLLAAPAEAIGSEADEGPERQRLEQLLLALFKLGS